MRVKSSADLAAAVRDARKSLGITQQELADLSGVSVRAISHLESGDSSVTFAKLMAVLSVLGLSLNLEVIPIGR
jgi:y4mF family transcriptional regulator